MTVVPGPVPARRSTTRPGLVPVLAVAAGGAGGAVVRSGLDLAFPVDVLGFPWPTLLVNLTGSAALAALLALPRVQGRPVLACFLGPGVLGGFTTFSAYAEQGRRLLDAGMTGVALGYLAGTLVASLLGCVAGRLAATALLRRAPAPSRDGAPR